MTKNIVLGSPKMMSSRTLKSAQIRAVQSRTMALETSENNLSLSPSSNLIKTITITTGNTNNIATATTSSLIPSTTSAGCSSVPSSSAPSLSSPLSSAPPLLPPPPEKPIQRHKNRRGALTIGSSKISIHSVLISIVMIGLYFPAHLHAQNLYNNNNNNNADGSNELWQIERPKDMAQIADLEVMCGKQHMEVKLTFDRPFNGIVFSKGAVDRYDCIYVKPQTGFNQYKFDIMYDSCGSKPDLNGRFYENNIVIQYDQDLIEVWDEAKRLRCEWYNDYEKGVTKPPIRVSDLEVVELNFRGEFDMRVKSCEASDDKNRPIQLSDQNGCVLRPKMISKFMKMRSSDARATVVTYAFFHAFKFPDSMAVQIRCKVEICRFGCPDHCQNPGNYVAREQEVTSSISSYKEPKLSVSSSNKQETYQAPTGQEQSNYKLKPQVTPTFNGYQPNPRNNNNGNNKIRSKLSRQSVENRRPKKPLKRRITSPSELQRSGGNYSPIPPILPIPSALKNEARSATTPLGRARIQSGHELGPPPKRQAPHPPRQTVGSPPRPHWRGTRREDPGAFNSEDGEEQTVQEEEEEEAGGFANFLGFKFPSLPKISLPFFGGSGDDEDEDEVEKDSKRRTMFIFGLPFFQAKRPSSVPVSRTANHGQPLVYPSSFNTANRPVEPIEELDGPFPYGPRALNAKSLEKVQKRKRRSILTHHLSTRSADVGVRSGYEVVSQVDLDFTPDEERPDVSVLKGRIQSEEVIYGVCLPALGFSALFVLLSLLTVISILVSGFVCYRRQVQKVTEESPPQPLGAPSRVLSQSHLLSAPPLATVADPMVAQQQMGWGFQTWFRKTRMSGIPAPMY
ncbi:hypothetical protein TCAL_05870 [Tigriopus californicus]|uniref:ZP domain-containing protein n=1 Tax=Tigriopus californicus TaxID=6832 RepID=A0A553NNV9_TIGCA|nr:hypothetical protein TCAL_05870 [Tigriopus californicus]